MKKVKVAFCLAIVCALAAGASAATKKAAGHTAHKAAMGAMSVTGCLKGSGDTFTLTPVSTAAKSKTMAASTPKPDWTITGAMPDMKLSDHVGHKVRITGTKEGDNTLKIKSMKHIAATCP